jgi:hypothetical protein
VGYFFSMSHNAGIGLATMPLGAFGSVYWLRWMCVP